MEESVIKALAETCLKGVKTGEAELFGMIAEISIVVVGDVKLPPNHNLQFRMFIQQLSRILSLSFFRASNPFSTILATAHVTFPPPLSSYSCPFTHPCPFPITTRIYGCLFNHFQQF
jgi:hypothetical protein